MKGKRGKAHGGKNQNKWEQVPIDEEFLSNKEFENLVSFEVLNDYTIIKKATPADDSPEVTNKKSKKGKRKPDDVETETNNKQAKLENTSSEDIIEHVVVNDLNEDAGVKLLKKKGQKGDKQRNAKQTTDTSKESNDEACCESPSGWIVTDSGSIDTESDSNEHNIATAAGKNAETRKKLKAARTEKRSKAGKKNVPGKILDDGVDDEEKEKPYENMDEWIKMGVTDPVLKALYDKNFLEPTPIQKLTLPSSILGRKDIVGAAETGSGKTLAFGIPIIEGILKDKAVNGDDRSLKALILTPTRELAVQIKDHIKAAAQHTKIQAVVIVGGLATQKQERLLACHPEIVIGTPGRLWELVREGNEHLSSLSGISYLAVDETDRMVEKGHFQELEGILAAVNSDPDSTESRQNFIFSATLSFTHELPDRFRKASMKAKKMKQAPKKVNKKEKLRQIMELVGVKENAKIVDITEKRGTCETLTEMQLTCQLAHKDYYLYYFLVRHPGRTIVFCNSINCVRRLTNLFFLLKCEPLALHSDMVQKHRLRSLERFSANENGILIATDVAARGLDIVDINHVIHYQVPKTAESYIHRSGRTARAFKGGLAILFAEPGENNLVTNILRSLDRDEAFPVFEVDGGIFQEIKTRVDMAIKVEAFEHTIRKKLADMNWMEKARKEMDLASSEEESEEDEEYQRGNKGFKKNLEKAKKELDVCKQKLSNLLGVNLFLTKPKTDVRSTLKKLSKIKENALSKKTD